MAVACATALAARDPTVPPAEWLAAQPARADAGAKSAGGETARVQMIVTGKSRRFALVNGRLVKVGDAISDTRVVAVRPDRVVTEEGAKSLGIMPGVSKTAPASTGGRKRAVVLPAPEATAKSN